MAAPVILNIQKSSFKSSAAISSEGPVGIAVTTMPSVCQTKSRTS
jgi:hypothetical protein